MSWRWLRSRWLWLVVCVVAGSLAFTVPALQAMHQAMQIADAFSSGIRDALSEAGFRGPREEPRRATVSFLFGLVEVKDTPYPYLWSAIGGIVTGGGLGVVAWGLFQAGVSGWRLRKRQEPARPAEPSASADSARSSSSRSS